MKTARYLSVEGLSINPPQLLAAPTNNLLFDTIKIQRSQQATLQMETLEGRLSGFKWI